MYLENGVTVISHFATILIKDYFMFHFIKYIRLTVNASQSHVYGLSLVAILVANILATAASNHVNLSRTKDKTMMISDNTFQKTDDSDSPNPDIRSQTVYSDDPNVQRALFQC